MDSVTHVLTVDSVRLGGLGPLGEIALAERDAPPAGRVLAGCWTSKTGRLNQMYRLWRVEGPDAGLQALARPSVLLDRQERLLSERMPTLTSYEGASLYELRTYQFNPGRASDFVELLLGNLEEREKLSKAGGLWIPLNGGTDELVHLWPFRDFDHYNQVRAIVAESRDWDDYRRKALPLLVSQSSLLLTPTPASPMR